MNVKNSKNLIAQAEGANAGGAGFVTCIGGNKYQLPSVIQSTALTANATNLQPSFTGIPEAVGGIALANYIVWNPFTTAGNALAINFMSALLATYAMEVSKAEYYDSLNTSSIAIRLYDGSFTGNNGQIISLTVDAASSTSSRTVVSNSKGFTLTSCTCFTIAVPNTATGATLNLYPRRLVPYNELGV